MFFLYVFLAVCRPIRHSLLFGHLLRICIVTFIHVCIKMRACVHTTQVETEFTLRAPYQYWSVLCHTHNHTLVCYNDTLSSSIAFALDRNCVRLSVCASDCILLCTFVHWQSEQRQYAYIHAYDDFLHFYIDFDFWRTYFWISVGRSSEEEKPYRHKHIHICTYTCISAYVAVAICESETFRLFLLM